MRAKHAGVARLVTHEAAAAITGRGSRSSSQTLLALMVTDLVGFTSVMQSLGNERARAILRVHDGIVRASLRRHRGLGVNHTGDGFIAGFSSVRSAMDCAFDVKTRWNREMAREGTGASARMDIRIALHAGEVMLERGRLFGLSVNTTFRVCAKTQADHIAVTERVLYLAEGCACAVGKRRSVKLKGLRARMGIYDLLTTQSTQSTPARPPLSIMVAARAY